MQPQVPTVNQAEVRTAESDSIKAEKSLILRTIEKLAEAKQKLKAAKEMVKDSLGKDKQYSTVAESIGTLKDNLKREEERVKNTPEVLQHSTKVLELKESVKDIQESLENHLYSYEAATGKTVIETDDGKKIYLVKKVKLASGQLALFEK